MPRDAETAIGVDVGGTNIRAARIGPDGRIRAHLAEPVRRDRAGLPGQLLRLIAGCRAADSVAVGIGIPGRVDAGAQQVVSAGYLDIAGLDIPALIRRETGLPARIGNDAAMALMAECRNHPAGLIAMITIGTGIGGAITMDGQPWYGGGLAGQFGHIVVAAEGPVCKCGRVGCVETFSSGTALARLIAGAGLPPGLRAAELLRRAAAGDGQAAAILTQWAAPLRRALQSLIAIAQPRLVIIGGGLGAEMAQALARIGGDAESWFPLDIAPARLGGDAGVIGAGLCALAMRQEGAE
ncbi:ROK family protein [Paracoccus sp. (in: a-proteobacteria)]|uniref:ROK family protein n=1 Tax=Paracoccus sp. TaxID=267 RepID=UPI003A8AAC18